MLSSRGARWSAHAIRDGRIRLSIGGYPIRQASRFAGPSARSKPQTHPSASASARAFKASWRPLAGQRISPNPSLFLIRFNSTAREAPVPTNATDSVTPSSLDQASQLRPEDFLPMTEHIGYLKEMGLDYGWGPTSLMEWVFEHIHVWTGTPWWLSITLTALVVRAVLIKPMLGASDQAAKLQAMKPVTGPLTDKMRERQKAGDTVGVMKARSELKQVHARAGIQTWKSFIPMIQLPLGYGVFRLTRGMAALPVPGLEDGGLFWFRDLTVADPYYILPLATAILLHLAMRRGGELGVILQSGAMRNLFVYGLPGMTFLFMFSWPGALQLSFFVGGLSSFTQGGLLRNPAFRSWAGLSPIPRSPGPGSTTANARYQGTLTVAPTYQAPSRASQATSTADTVKATDKVRGVVEGAVKEIRGMGSEMKKTAEKYTAGQATAPGKRTKAELEQARNYEAKRQKELQQQRWDEAEAKRARWRERKEAKEQRRRG